MKAATKPDLTAIAAQWREARRLYAVYSALLGRYALGLPPCRELESPVDRADPDAIRNVWNWFAQMDQRVHVHQLRQLVQTTRLGTEENLRALIQRHLAKPEKSEADRDKIDFLLVQYLSTCAPSGFYDRDPSFEEVAHVLEPVLVAETQRPGPPAGAAFAPDGVERPGPPAGAAFAPDGVELAASPQTLQATPLPEWIRPLEKATKSLDELSSLRDLLENRTLDQMRKLKAGAGEMYFSPAALAAITRFNFMVRRTFVRLIAADLTAIRGALHELESRGVEKVDCFRAQLSRQESLENLKQICAEWKKPFRAAYAAGQNFRQLVEIRAAVEKALSGDTDVAGVAPPLSYPSLERQGGSHAVHDMSSAVDDAPLTEDAFAGPALTGDVASNVSTRGNSNASTPAFGADLLDTSGWEPGTGNRGQGSSAWEAGTGNRGLSSDADSEFAAALAHVQSAASASPEIPVETPASIASQLFQGAASSSAVNWEPVGDDVDDTPPPPPVSRSDARVAQPSSAVNETLDIHATATSIAEQLVANHVKKGQVATITGENLKLLLSSWEVDSFIAGGNETASALQRIVAARAMLIQQLEKKKRNEAQRVGEAVRLAKAEIKKIQDQIFAAKMKKDIDAAVNMAATCKRLQTLVSEAEKKS